MGARLPAEVRLTIYEDMAAAEPLWRAFERQADGTVFQSYQWLAAWQRHVGARQEVRPAIVIAQDASGAPLALFALAVRRARFARELIWLGSELCDYNGPLLAPGFAERFDGARFRTLWDDIERASAGASASGLRPDQSQQDARARRRASRPDAAFAGEPSIRAALTGPSSAPTGRASTPPSALRRRAGATAPSASGCRTSARSFSSRRTAATRCSTRSTR